MGSTVKCIPWVYEYIIHIREVQSNVHIMNTQGKLYIQIREVLSNTYGLTTAMLHGSIHSLVITVIHSSRHSSSHLQ